MTILEQFQQRQQTQEVFLWAHFAALALLPLALVLTMAGLAVGDPLFPGWIEMPILAVPIIAYVVWQQWHRPYYPFSLGLVHRSVTALSVEQRQILTILKRPTTGWIAVVVGLFLYALFRQIYFVAPLAQDIAPFPDSWRFLGIVWSLVFFFVANVIAQLGVVALRVFVLPESELQTAYDPEQIKQDFTVLGAARTDLWRFAEPDSEIEPNRPDTNPVPDRSPELATTSNPTEPVPDDSPELATTSNPTELPQDRPVAEKLEEATLPDIPDLVFTTEAESP